MGGNARFFFSNLLDSLFPVICPLCRQVTVEAHAGFCALCAGTLPLIWPPFCSRCGIPLPSEEGGISQWCQSCGSGGSVECRIRSVGLFSGGLRTGILRFKFDRDMAVGKSLAAVLVRWFPLLYPAPEYDVILPVPLHPRRLREREFNQSILLARPLATSLSLPLDLTSVQRTRNTTPQSMLRERERRENVRDAFAVTRPSCIEGTNILLLDDVCTTGTTLYELARLLLVHGAARVDAVAVARVIAEVQE
jgi:ComF family protein